MRRLLSRVKKVVSMVVILVIVTCLIPGGVSADFWDWGWGFGYGWGYHDYGPWCP